MKKILSIAMISLVILSTFAALTPQVIANPPASTIEPVEKLGDGDFVRCIAIDSTNLYFTEYGTGDVPLRYDGNVKAVPIGGGAVEPLVPDENTPWRIAVDSDYVYYIAHDAGRIMKVVKAGGSPETLASGLHHPWDIAVGPDYVYFTERNGGNVKRVPKSGGVVEILATAHRPNGIAIDSNYVYFTERDAGNIKRVPLSGGTVELIASGLNSFVFSITVDSDFVYFIEKNSNGRVGKVPKEGGSISILASNQNAPFFVVTDSDYVYYTEAGAGNVKKVAKSGGPVEIVASGYNNPEGIAIDLNYLYFSDYSGVYKQAKATSCSWHSTTSLPIPLYTTGVVTHNDEIYVVGGSTGGASVDTVYYATIKTDGHVDHNDWLSTTPIPDARGNPAVVTYDDWIYILGGSANRPPHWIERDTVWFAAFNPDGTIGSWTETTSMPYRSPEVAVQWNGRIYILAGWNGFSQHDDVHYAEINPDGTLGSWIRTTSLPEVRAHGHQAVVHNGVIYFIGGTTGRTGPPHIHREVYYATIQPEGGVGAWTETAPLPVGLEGHAAVVWNDDLYVMGGVSQSAFPEQVITDKVFKAHTNPDGSLDSWVEWCRMPEPLHHPSSVVLNNRLYVIGGSPEGGILVDTVYFTGLAVEPDFTISVSPSQQDVVQGGITSFVVDVTSIGGFSSSVSISLQGLQPEWSAQVTPPNVSPPSSSLLIVSVSSSTPIDTYTLAIKGTGSGKERICEIMINVVSLTTPTPPTLPTPTAEVIDTTERFALPGEDYKLFAVIEGPYFVATYYTSEADRTITGSLVMDPDGNVVSLSHTSFKIFYVPAVIWWYRFHETTYLGKTRSFALMANEFYELADYMEDKLDQLEWLIAVSVGSTIGTSLASLFIPAGGGLAEFGISLAGHLFGIYETLSLPEKFQIRDLMINMAERYTHIAELAEELSVAWSRISPNGGSYESARITALKAKEWVQIENYKETLLDLRQIGEIAGLSEAELQPLDDSIDSFTEIQQNIDIIVERIVELFSKILQNQRSSLFEVQVESPICLLITDPLGRQTGYDPNSKTEINDIPGAVYTGVGSEPQIVSIPNPIEGDYEVRLIGTDTGPYTLTIEMITSEETICQTYAGEIVQGAVYVYNVDLTAEVIITGPDPVAELEHLKKFMDGLPDGSFDKPRLASQRKNALFNKLNEVILKVEAGNYTDALNKLLHDIRAKMDGDTNVKDWITDSEKQYSLCVIIDHIISSIETLQLA